MFITISGSLGANRVQLGSACLGSLMWLQSEVDGLESSQSLAHSSQVVRAGFQPRQLHMASPCGPGLLRYGSWVPKASILRHSQVGTGLPYMAWPHKSCMSSPSTPCDSLGPAHIHRREMTLHLSTGGMSKKFGTCSKATRWPDSSSSRVTKIVVRQAAGLEYLTSRKTLGEIS